MVSKFFELSIARQCRLLSVPRSSLYFQSAPVPSEELALMRLMRIVPIYPKRNISRPNKPQGISMDGRSHCMDNVFIEHLWRSLKYKKVYMKVYDTVAKARPASVPECASTTPNANIRVLTTRCQIQSTSVD